MATSSSITSNSKAALFPDVESQVTIVPLFEGKRDERGVWVSPPVHAHLEKGVLVSCLGLGLSIVNIVVTQLLDPITVLAYRDRACKRPMSSLDLQGALTTIHDVVVVKRDFKSVWEPSVGLLSLVGLVTVDSLVNTMAVNFGGSPTVSELRSIFLSNLLWNPYGVISANIKSQPYPQYKAQPKFTGNIVSGMIQLGQKEGALGFVKGLEMACLTTLLCGRIIEQLEKRVAGPNAFTSFSNWAATQGQQVYGVRTTETIVYIPSPARLAMSISTPLLYSAVAGMVVHPLTQIMFRLRTAPAGKYAPVLGVLECANDIYSEGNTLLSFYRGFWLTTFQSLTAVAGFSAIALLDKMADLVTAIIPKTTLDGADNVRANAKRE